MQNHPRLSPEQVVAAYRKAKAHPTKIRAIEVVCDEHLGQFPVQERALISLHLKQAQILERYLGLEPSYVDGFQQGFDLRLTLSSPTEEPERSRQLRKLGYDDGRAVMRKLLDGQVLFCL